MGRIFEEMLLRLDLRGNGWYFATVLGFLLLEAWSVKGHERALCID